MMKSESNCPSHPPVKDLTQYKYTLLHSLFQAFGNDAWSTVLCVTQPTEIWRVTPEKCSRPVSCKQTIPPGQSHPISQHNYLSSLCRWCLAERLLYRWPHPRLPQQGQTPQPERSHRLRPSWLSASGSARAPYTVNTQTQYRTTCSWNNSRRSFLSAPDKSKRGQVHF